MECFECEDGIYQTVIQSYLTTGGGGCALIVKNVPYMVCRLCGEELLSAAACKMIEEARIADGVKTI